MKIVIDLIKRISKYKVILGIFLISSPVILLASHKDFPAQQVHLISISPTKPFPSEVKISSLITASFSIMNISNYSLTIKDSTIFPSGMRLLISTCDKVLNSGDSCSLTLELHAPDKPQMINMQLIEVAATDSNLQDVSQYPIVIKIAEQLVKYSITPKAEEGGSIAPATPQEADKNGSITFTAKPAIGYVVNKWYLDDEVAQEGKTTYKLSNIDADHLVSVTFQRNESPTNIPFVALSNIEWNATNPELQGQITVSKDSGKTWQRLKLTSDKLSGVDCTGKADNAICMLATPTSIFTSHDITQPWSEVSLPGMNMRSVSCSSGGEDSTCIAITGFPDTKKIGIIISNNGGNAWHRQVLDADPYPKSSSCSGTGKNAICNIIASAGVITSIDAGNSWKSFPDIIPPFSFYLTDTSCTGQGEEAVCTIVGKTGLNQNTFIASTENGARKWVERRSDEGTPEKVSCIGGGSTAICLTVGGLYEDSYTTGFIISSVDGAKTWKYLKIDNLPSPSTFSTVKCSGTTKNSVCLAAGYYEEGRIKRPFIVSSTDNGQNWIINKFPLLEGIFISSACYGGGKIASCAVGGSLEKDYKITQPLLVTTSDGGATWEVKTEGLPTGAVAISHIGTIKE